MGEFKIRRLFKNGEMHGSEKIQDARCIEYTQVVWIFLLTQRMAIFSKPAKDRARGSRMRVWLPHCVYRSFPLFVGTVGLAGCLAGNPASLALGGVLMLYSGGVCYLRRS